MCVLKINYKISNARPDENTQNIAIAKCSDVRIRKDACKSFVRDSLTVTEASKVKTQSHLLLNHSGEEIRFSGSSIFLGQVRTTPAARCSRRGRATTS